MKRYSEIGKYIMGERRLPGAVARSGRDFPLGCPDKPTCSSAFSAR